MLFNIIKKNIYEVENYHILRVDPLWSNVMHLKIKVISILYLNG